MQTQIINYLATFEDREYHEINGFVKGHYFTLSVTDLRQILQRLSDKKRIEFDPNRSFNRWGQYTRIHAIHTEENTMADYDNWPAFARLTLEELERIEEDNYKKQENKSQPMNVKDSILNVGSTFYESPQSAGESSSHKNIVNAPTKAPIINKIIIGIIIGLAVLLIGHFVFKIG